MPDCQEHLKKGHYLDETREDTLYNKDVEKRKEVLAVFNKTRDDFDSLDEYDEYLADVEEMIDVLIHGTPP